MAAWRQWLADWAAQGKTTQKLGPVGPVIQRQAQRHALQLRLQQNPSLRFETLAEVQLAAELGVSIDVNRAVSKTGCGYRVCRFTRPVC